MTSRTCPNCHGKVEGTRCATCGSVGRYYPFELAILAGFVLLLVLALVVLSLKVIAPSVQNAVHTRATVRAIASKATHVVQTTVAKTPTATPGPRTGLLELDTSKVTVEQPSTDQDAALPLRSLEGTILLISKPLGVSRLYLVNTDQTRQLLANADFAAIDQPVWSTDGARFAFTGLKDGARNIYIGTPEGTTCQATACPDLCTSPAWTPDGDHLVYLNGSQAEIVSADCNGVSSTTFLRRYTNLAALDWSPKDIVALATRPGSSPALTLQDMEIDRAEQIDLGTPVSAPRWSRDGTFLSFIALDGRTKILYVLRYATGQLMPTAIRAENILGPSWSPTQDALLFSAHDGNTWRLHFWDVTTKDTRIVGTELKDVQAISWSR